MATTKKMPTPRRRKADPEAAPRVQRPVRRAAKAAPVAPQSQTSAKAAPAGKLGLIVGLMRRPEGATIVQMSEATDWLPHSVRGALAGAVKKKHKLAVTSEKTEVGRVYRIALLAVPEPSAG